MTFNHPPINSVTATTVAELAELVGLIEQDSDLNVLVFDSANPEVDLTQYDPQSTTRPGPRRCREVRPGCTPGPTCWSAFPAHPW